MTVMVVYDGDGGDGGSGDGGMGGGGVSGHVWRLYVVVVCGDGGV